MRRLLLLFAPLLSVGACNGDSFSDDAGPDTGTTDVIVSGGDATADAPADVAKEAASKRYCQTVDAQFCADFDIPNDAGAGFQPPNTTNGYTLTFQTNQSKSAPTGVEVFIPADAGGIADLNTVVLPVDGGGGATVTLDMDMYIPNLPTPTTQPLFFFLFGAVAPQFQFGLAHDGSAWKLEYLPAKSGSTFTSPFAFNEWLHITLVVVPSNTAGSVMLTITSSAGTSNAVIAPGQYPTAPPNTGPYPFVLDIGAQTSVPPLSTAQAYFDNVVIRFQ